MRKHFNVAGPCREDEHYMIDATERLHNELADLIDSKQYFVIHAARQVGKTTLLLNLRDKLNAEGKYYALYCSLENVQPFPNPEQGIPAILNCLKTDIRFSQFPDRLNFAKNMEGVDISNQIRTAITDYCVGLDRPLVLFFDEADCMSENTLISFLRQLRNGYVNRTSIPFPVSIALVGMRNIRDYKAKIRANQETLGTASPFNIITESLTLRNFTKEEVYQLYNQHTTATGQIFEKSAIELAFEQTQGQPWLVNAIAREVVEKQLKKDFSITITPQMIETAINTIILRRDVHID
ncbi:MAG: ATP-binding protein, partial [Bacteroidales bacterium]|nr:ATP-binding protein [Bacteroidales bacterium]